MSWTILYSPPLPPPGDEIDYQYQQEMQEIIELSGSPEVGFRMFSDVVKNLFELNDQGVGKG